MPTINGRGRKILITALMLAFVFVQGVFEYSQNKSKADAHQWSEILPRTDVQVIATSKSNPALVLYGIDKKLYRSDNYGMNPYLAHTFGRDVAAIDIAPQNAAYWAIEIAGEPVHTTEDSGQTFRVSGPTGSTWMPYVASDIEYGVTNNNIIYATDDNDLGLYKSTDRGINWTKILASPVTEFTQDPQNANHLYVGGSQYDHTPENAGNRIYESTNGGTTWTNITIQTERGYLWVKDIQAMTSSWGYATTSLSYVVRFFHDESGNLTVDYNNYLNNVFEEFVVDPRYFNPNPNYIPPNYGGGGDNNVIYAIRSTNGMPQGVWKSTDGGEHFSQFPSEERLFRFSHAGSLKMVPGTDILLAGFRGIFNYNNPDGSEGAPMPEEEVLMHGGVWRYTETLAPSVATFNADPPSVVYKNPVTVSGTLTSGGNPQVNQTVFLQKKYQIEESGNLENRYYDLASAQTNGSGQYSFILNPLETREYRIRYAGSPTVEGSYSADFTIDVVTPQFSISATKVVTYGAKANISGKLMLSGQPMANQKIYLQHEYIESDLYVPTFKDLKSGYTDANGNYSFISNGVGSYTKWRIRTEDNYYSPITATGIRASLYFTASKGTHGWNNFFVMYRPASNGRMRFVYLQKKVNGAWRNVQKVRLGAYGSAKFSYKVSSPGKYYFRIYTPSYSGIYSAFSSYKSLTWLSVRGYGLR